MVAVPAIVWRAILRSPFGLELTFSARRKAISVWLYDEWSYAAGMLRVVFAVLVMVGFATGQEKSSEERVLISWQVASGRLEKKVVPKCCLLARGRAAGEVLVGLDIDEQGSVRSAEVLNSDLVLVSDALQAVKQWRFKPYLLGGQPVKVVTQALVSVCTEKDRTDEHDRQLGAAFVKQFRACEKTVEEEKWEQAEAKCSQSLQLASNLPSELYAERSMASRELGHVRLMQNRPADAKPLLMDSLQLLEEHERSDDYDVGQTVLMLGMAEHGLGNVPAADRAYVRAAEIFEQKLKAVRTMSHTTVFKGLRSQYEKRLNLIYKLHAQLLQDSGDKAGAAVIRQKAIDRPH
jgi:TonB family protein